MLLTNEDKIFNYDFNFYTKIDEIKEILKVDKNLDKLRYQLVPSKIED